MLLKRKTAYIWGRDLIQIRCKDKQTPYKIAKELGCAPNTVCKEIKRGTVLLYGGIGKRYKAKAGQQTYERNRAVCCRRYDRFKKDAFIQLAKPTIVIEQLRLSLK